MKKAHINYLIELVRQDVAQYRKPGTHFGQSEKRVVEELNEVIQQLEELKKH